MYCKNRFIKRGLSKIETDLLLNHFHNEFNKGIDSYSLQETSTLIKQPLECAINESKNIFFLLFAKYPKEREPTSTYLLNVDKNIYILTTEDFGITLKLIALDI